MKWSGKSSFIVIAALLPFLFYVQKNRDCGTTTITSPNNLIIQAEIARTELEQTKGLSFRKKLDPDKGMLFLFKNSDIHTFWMKNTLIPLDIIWISDHTVVEVAQLQPADNQTIPSYTPQNMADAVLEIPSGQASVFSISPGSHISWTEPCPIQ